MHPCPIPSVDRAIVGNSIVENSVVAWAVADRADAQSQLIGPEELIKKLASTNRQAAHGLICRRFGERLLRQADRILRDEAEAADVVQEVLIKAMREPRMFDNDFRIQAWLFRVCRNLCFNLSRDRRRRQGLLNCYAVPERISQRMADDPIDALFGAERQEDMLGALDQLSPEHREILILRYYEDKSYAEIATTLQIKLGTVMSRLSRARDRLLLVLSDEPALMAASR